MKPIVRKGDALLEHGGAVLEGHYFSEGRSIACKGDAALCSSHGRTQIAEGCDLLQFDNRPVALHGHRCACGCTLVSSKPDTQVGS
jgi:uncharacterized Zn-binding protein involved in type VI secretion